MDKKNNLGFNFLQLLYPRYKRLVLPILVIVISFFLFMNFILPQIQGLFSAKQDIQAAYAKLNVLKTNLDTLNKADDANLDNQLQILVKALPAGKDFSGILSALAVASTKTKVSLGNFSFQVGDLSVSAASNKNLFLKLNLSVDGDIRTVNNFINVLSNTLPLSEVTSVDIGNKTSMITIIFYYKPLPPIVYSDDLPITVMTKKDSALIDKLSSFNNVR